MASLTEINEAHVNLYDFCDKHAKAAAVDLVTAFCSYKAFKSCDGIKSPYSLYAEFAKKFADRFIIHFGNEFLKRNPIYNDHGSSSVQSNNAVNNNVNSNDELSDFSENEAETPSPKCNQKPFFRRLSFKGLRKGKGFFRKQDSDELELSSNDKKNDKNVKSKLAKITVECRRNGLVNYLVAENIDNPGKWEKCRLSLSSSAAGGYILVFYSPPKSVKPKCGIFCHLITEVRETTPLEMPDKDSTFVVRAAYNVEYVIEAQSSEDRRDWVATLKYCMRESRAMIDGSDRVSLGTGNDDNTVILRSGTISNKSLIMDSEIPDLPPRPPVKTTDVLSSSLRSDTLNNSHMDIDSAMEAEYDASAELKEYPWFHGNLVRSEATNLVQHCGESGHGVFLVRQSETRKGEFVLTFNYYGRAKHLRLLLNDIKQCWIQHLWFTTIFDALEYFRKQPIPLENGNVGEVKLTEYIINTPPPAQPSIQRIPGNQTDYRHPIAAPQPREIVKFNGPVRVKTEYLELRENMIPPNLVPTTSTSSTSAPSNTSRAVANTYSFI